MIQIYKPDNTDFSKNGDIALFPTAAGTHAILNGAWEATLEHPIDPEGRWKYITEEAVVKMPSFSGSGDQIYRIKTVQKQDSGVSATLEPIFYDAMGDCWLTDVRPTSKNGQEALDIMLASNSKYSGQSNITRASTAYYQSMNFLQALNGDIDQSFINRWGGEILFDNYTVIVNDRMGGDYGVELRYGKNIPQDGMSYEVDIRDVVTRIYPQAYNGHKMSGAGYVNSPLLNNYPTVKTAAMTFDNVKMAEDAQEGDAEKGIIICDTQEELDAALEAQCEAQYDAGLDKPKVTISADMILLQNTEQYKDVKVLEEVGLGDTIHCINNHLGIVTDARIIEIEYDSIRKKVSSVVIGDFQGNYFDGVTSAVSRIDGVIDHNGNVVAERVAGILNGIQTQIRLQSTVAQKVEGRAFQVEDLDPASALYGCMIWGTQGLQISTTRTPDGKDWDWTTAITAKGIVADAILTGILSDRTGTNYWNLDTGEFSLTSAVKIKTPDGDVSLPDYIKEQAEAASSLSVIASRDFIGVPTDADGENGNYQNASVTIQVFYGDTDVSGQVTYSVQEDGVTGTWDESTATYQVTNLPGDDGQVQVSVTYQGVITARKMIQVAKIKAGAAGEAGASGAYRYLVLSTQTAKRNADGTLIPTSFTAYAYEQTTDGTEAYPAIFKVEETTDGAVWTETYESSAEESSIECELNNVVVDDHGNYVVTDTGLRIDAGGINNVSSVRVSLYDASGEQLIDMQSVTVISEAQELTSEDVFNLLTDNGRIQGLYRIGDQIYMNASYIRSGTYVVGGINNERGIIQILDEDGNPVGMIDSSGMDIRNIEVDDRIIIYNSAKNASVSLGFEAETNTFWISGSPVSFNELSAVMTTIRTAAFNFATVNTTFTIASGANFNCNGSFVCNNSAAPASFYDISARNVAAGSVAVTGGDVAADGISLKNHTHDGIYHGTRKLVFDNTGSVQHIRTMNNGTLLDGEIYLGSNASRFNSVYAKNGTIQTSDEREKNVIGELDDRHYALLRKLRPILYRWKKGDNGLHAGFSAQALKRAMEECGIPPEEQFAIVESDGRYSLSYSELIPLVVCGLLKLLDRMDRIERGE